VADILHMMTCIRTGAVEIFFKHNAVWRPGLTWKQTYLYFWSGLQVGPTALLNSLPMALLVVVLRGG
jgi:hypothetical protein